MTTELKTMDHLFRYLKKHSVKHPTALLHFERTLSDFSQGVIFLTIQIVQNTEKDKKGFYYLNKSLARTAMRYLNNEDYQRVSRSVDEISRTKLLFNFLGQDRTFDSYTAPLISGIADGKKHGVVAFTVDPVIEKLIKDPKVFARINLVFLSILSDIKLGYAVYTFLLDAYCRGERTFRVSLSDFKSYLGYREDEYPVFKDFKRNVLQPNLEAVNKRTDMSASYTGIKTGRKLTHLEFTVDRNNNWQLPLVNFEEIKNLAIEMSKNFSKGVLTLEAGKDRTIHNISPVLSKKLSLIIEKGVSRSTVDRFVGKHSEQDMQDIIDYGEIHSKGKEYKSYMAKCMNEGYGVKTDKEREVLQKSKKKDEERKQQQQYIKQLKKKASAVERKFSTFKKNKAKRILKNRSEQEVVKFNGEMSGKLPVVSTIKNSWKNAGADYRKLDANKPSERLIWSYVVTEVLQKWGAEDDLDFDYYCKRMKVSDQVKEHCSKIV